MSLLKLPRIFMSPASFVMRCTSCKRNGREREKLVWIQVSRELSLSTQAKDFAMTGNYAWTTSVSREFLRPVGVFFWGLLIALPQKFRNGASHSHRASAPVIWSGEISEPF